MRLLLITQVVDSTDSSLGFFHSWIDKLSRHFESIEVICLYEGVHNLPPNVHVYSLGKEKGSGSTMWYSLRFLSLIWCLRRKYDRVFVHMNQEYVLLGGLSWRSLGKRVYLWRNHYSGTFLTSISAFLSAHVFYTSAHSYTARFRNALQMPVGVETDLFENKSITRKDSSILFFGRVTPSKKPDLLIEALGILQKKAVSFTASFYGPVRASELSYLESLKTTLAQHGLDTNVTFHDGVAHSKAPAVFAEHEIYVNLGDSGMYDKMLFEACASGCLVVALSSDFKNALEHPVAFEATASSLASALEKTVSLNQEEKNRMRQDQQTLVAQHSLQELVSKLSSVLLEDKYQPQAK